MVVKITWIDGVDGAAVEERPNLLNCSLLVHHALPVQAQAMQQRLPEQPGDRSLGPSPHQAALQSGNISEEL